MAIDANTRENRRRTSCAEAKGLFSEETEEKERKNEKKNKKKNSNTCYNSEKQKKEGVRKK